MQDCQAPGPTDLRAYMIWGQGSDHAYLGNVVGNSTREHNIRMTGLERVLIYDNDLANLDRSKTDKYDQTKGCVEMHNGSFAYIAGNRIHYGSIRTGPRGGSTETAATATDWCVIDGNDLTDAQIRHNAGSHHIMDRNNVSPTATTARRSRWTAPTRPAASAGDLTIAHNTEVDSGTTGIFCKVWGKVDGLTLADNLFVAPHLHAGVDGSAGVNVQQPAFDGITAIGHDVWPVPEAFENGADGGMAVLGNGKEKRKIYRSPDQWNALPGVTDDRFTRDLTVDDRGVPAAGGPATGAAVPVPGTALDHDGHPRPDGPQTAGAFQVGRG